MAEGEENEEKKTQSLKESLMDIFAKAKSAIRPFRKSDSSLLTIDQKKVEGNESPISQKLWSSVKKLNTSMSDFSNFTSRNLHMYFNPLSPTQGVSVRTASVGTSISIEDFDGNTTDDTRHNIENKTLDDDTENTTWDDSEDTKKAKDETGVKTSDDDTESKTRRHIESKLRNDRELSLRHGSLHNIWDDIEPSGDGLEVHLNAYNWNSETPRRRFTSTCTETSLSSPVSWEIEQLNTIWKVTPATPTPEAASNNSSPEEDDQPVFDWSDFDWKEGESNPPRGMLFPFPIRPISRTESCPAIMDTDGSSASLED